MKSTEAGDGSSARPRAAGLAQAVVAPTERTSAARDRTRAPGGVVPVLITSLGRLMFNLLAMDGRTLRSVPTGRRHAIRSLPSPSKRHNGVDLLSFTPLDVCGADPPTTSLQVPPDEQCPQRCQRVPPRTHARTHAITAPPPPPRDP